MNARCSVCRHPRRVEIDRALLDGVPLRAVAGEYGISKDAAGRHKAHTEARLEQAEAEIEAWRTRLQADHARLRRDARASFRAMDGWAVARIADHDAWEVKVLEAAENFDRGRYFIDHLGAERVLDPDEAATLLALRTRMIAEHGGAPTVAESLLIDVILMDWQQMWRLDGIERNLVLHTETQFFGVDPPQARAEEHLRAIGERILPLQERTQALLLQAIRTRQHLRRVPAPQVLVNTAGQINVGDKQVNVVESTNG